MFQKTVTWIKQKEISGVSFQDVGTEEKSDTSIN